MIYYAKDRIVWVHYIWVTEFLCEMPVFEKAGWLKICLMECNAISVGTLVGD